MIFTILQKLIYIILVSEIMSCEENSSANMALAIYEPSNILTVFKSDARQFKFAGKIVNIIQDWEKNGVAAVVWDAALVLAKYLEMTIDLSGKRVIELGAGTGLVGIVAGYLGAHVIITDRKMALNLANENVLRNSDNLNGSMVNVRELEWGQEVSCFNPPFDYILGADIVYIEDTFTDLLKTITELSNEKTVVLLACKIRYQRDKNFLGLLNEKFEVTKAYYDMAVDIYVYKAVRRAII